MGSGVYLFHGEGVRHPTIPVPKNDYPKLISHKQDGLYNYFKYPNQHKQKANMKQKMKINEMKKKKIYTKADLT